MRLELLIDLLQFNLLTLFILIWKIFLPRSEENLISLIAKSFIDKLTLETRQFLFSSYGRLIFYGKTVESRQIKK